MIKEILITILPSMFIIFGIVLFGLIIRSIKLHDGIKSVLLGLCAVIPALITIHFLKVLIELSVSANLSISVILLLSALNEEIYKYLFISISYKDDVKYIKGLLVAGGFALGETLFLCFGDPETAFYRGFITLPLHMITSIFLTMYYKKKRPLFLTAALIIHILFNLIIR